MRLAHRHPLGRNAPHGLLKIELGANKDWSMPNVGEQVACLVDWDGEDGCVLGGLWSDKDTPPTDDPDVEHRKYESGLETIVNRKTGDITVKGANSMDIEAATITNTPRSRPASI